VNRPSILDPRFRYVPAVGTDVSATWRRFGFRPERNSERRTLFGRPARPTAPDANETAPSFRLVRHARAPG
jgi:hypothetical protein